MAVWAIPSDQVIDYSPNGDDVDSFSQKVKFCLENIFECLQHLHTNGAQAGLGGDTSPYEIRINTTDDCIYMRNGDDTDWILLGKVDENFGITADSLKAVKNGGGVQRFLMGTEANMPTTGNNTNDLYFSPETSRIFRWTGKTWDKFLTRHFDELLDYEKWRIPLVVLSNVMTATGGAAGAGKILQLDPQTGKANVDITGSPAKLNDKLIEVQNLRDGHVLTYDANKDRFVNRPNYELTKDDTTYVGGIVNKDKLIRVSSDGTIHADVDGTATDTKQIAGVPIELKNLSDGEVLAFHASTNSFVNEARTAVGTGKTLSFYDGEKLLADYNGAASVDIKLNEVLANITTSQAATELAHLTRLVENLYLVLDVAGLNPGGYDRLSSNVFFDSANDVDYNRTNATLTDGKFSGDGVGVVTKPIAFVNEATGATMPVKRANLVVKHKNVADALIKAEIAFQTNAIFVKDEVIGVGTGVSQVVPVANTTNLTNYKFKLYFDGVEQTEGFTFSPANGEVTFTAQSNVIVSADYFYNWEPETFEEMENTGTYPDYHNPNRATTQFTYNGNGGAVATLKLTLIQGTGNASNEITATGTGRAQVFKFAHQAIPSTIQVFPQVTWTYNAAQNAVIVTAPARTNYQVSYGWKGKSFTVDSFACTFND